jgi:hypothetical protein
MKLTPETVEVLNNFASIQPNILIQQGNELNTLADARNIMGSATLNQSFPSKVAIYDLPEFLSVLSLIDDPELSFDDQFLTVSSSTGGASAVYYYSSEEILTYPKKKIVPPKEDIVIDLSAAVISKIKSASAVFGHTMVVFNNNSLTVCSDKQAKGTSNDNYYKATVPINVIADDLSSFSAIVAVENFKFIQDDYTVNISRQKLATFKAKNKGVEYFVSMDNASSFGE